MMEVNHHCGLYSRLRLPETVENDRRPRRGVAGPFSSHRASTGPAPYLTRASGYTSAAGTLAASRARRRARLRRCFSAAASGCNLRQRRSVQVGEQTTRLGGSSSTAHSEHAGFGN